MVIGEPARVVEGQLVRILTLKTQEELLFWGLSRLSSLYLLVLVQFL